jgi:hypothetical protein
MARVKDNEYTITIELRMRPNMSTSELDEMIQKIRNILESQHLEIINVYPKYHTDMRYIPYVEAEFITNNGDTNTTACETITLVHNIIAELLTFKQFRTTEITIKYMG